MDWFLLAQAAADGEITVDKALGWLQMLGIPGGIVAGVVGFLRLGSNAINQIGTWMKPLIEETFKKHNALVTTLEDTQKQLVTLQRESLQIQKETQTAIITLTGTKMEGHIQTHDAIVIATRMCEKTAKGTQHAEVVADHCQQIREAIE